MMGDKTMKLSRHQHEIIKLLNDGWELGLTKGKGLRSYYLRLEGNTLSVRRTTVNLLSRGGVLKSVIVDDPFFGCIYELVDKGRQAAEDEI